MQKAQIFQLLRRIFLQMKVCLRSGSRAAATSGVVKEMNPPPAPSFYKSIAP
jgi:hypothetical protein